MLFNQITFQLKLIKLQRSRQKVLTAFQDRFAEAVGKGRSSEAKEGLRHDERFALDEWDNEIDVLTTAHLLQQARRLQLPIPNPDDDQYWIESSMFGGKHLTAAGVTKLRSEIRTERKARWDFLSGQITLLIGLLGAIIGVLSVIRK